MSSSLAGDSARAIAALGELVTNSLA